MELSLSDRGVAFKQMKIQVDHNSLLNDHLALGGKEVLHQIICEKSKRFGEGDRFKL